ncbi:MAG: hypothetical protein ACK5LX_11680 [Oscillospiraceae bacterium]
MAKNQYDKDALFTKLLGGDPIGQAPKKEAAKQENLPRQSGEKSTKESPLSGKVGRPARTQEDVKKYSYYLTKRHVLSIKKLAANMDTDFSSVVRVAIEELARKNGEW